jgi:histidinol dehydrogenase
LRAAYFQSVSREGFGKLARPCVTLAETEGLKWHAESVKVRIGLE